MIEKFAEVSELDSLLLQVYLYFFHVAFPVSRSNHTRNDCLLIVVMTHGEENTISCYDSEYRIEKLIKPFTDRYCPSLRGKPRIFLIQACRGKKTDAGGVVKPKNLNTNQRYKLKKRQQDALDSNASRVQNKEQETIFRFEFPPIGEDFLIVRSAMLGYVSFRNMDTGSWFIQELCNELELNPDEDFLTLLTHVNWAVSERESNPHRFKEILCIQSMLTRLLYLK